MDNYFRQVYAGVLGKVIGVYMGRPFEGWKRDDIIGRLGEINRYVYNELGVPLVVADDDISGTFTFIKALSDSRAFAGTPSDFYGDNWLNYLIEDRTVLWWGGMGISTEHTAFLRLKQGVRAPASGSAALNGKVVSEQIGAQIFIDAFGMVAPGNPALAMELAEKAARVSHDGEAVIGAKVVAAMVSLAFVDKDIHSILDKVLKMIPQDSVIARVHRDVRTWVHEDGDWRRTYDRINDKYGYAKYGGGCHMIPNHAVMVMAWEYAGNDFFEAQKIVNTAGWDTDCNAANVGTVSAIITGLDGIDSKYGFHSHPEFADRMVIPTADGTDSVTDCLRVARDITRIGCIMNGFPLPVEVANAAWHDFSLPGALHGYIGMTSDTRVEYSPLSSGSAKIEFSAAPGAPSVIETPVSAAALKSAGGYQLVSTPMLYHGMDVSAAVECDELDAAGVDVCMEVVCGVNDASESKSFRSRPVRMSKGEAKTIEWRIDCEHMMIDALRFVVSSPTSSPVRGVARLTRVDISGEANVRLGDDLLYGSNGRTPDGWISTLDIVNRRKMFLRNEGTGLLVAGNRTWSNTAVTCTLTTHCSDKAGIVLNYQGLRRYYAVVISHSTLKVIRYYYGETVLFSRAVNIAEDEPFRLDASVGDGEIMVVLNGGESVIVHDDYLKSGGAGLVVENGNMLLRGDLDIRAVLPR